MSKEQKLKQLLDLAIKNGFKYHIENIYLFGFHADANKFTINKELICENTHVESHYLRWSFSINDLVLNTDFFECLFKGTKFDDLFYFTDEALENEEILEVGVFANTKDNGSYLEITPTQYLKFQWVLEVEKGTALNWLFKQFDL